MAVNVVSIKNSVKVDEKVTTYKIGLSNVISQVEGYTSIDESDKDNPKFLFFIKSLYFSLRAV